MKKSFLIAAAFTAVSGFAAEYYWNKNAEQSLLAPLDWNDASSWMIGGDSQWDAPAETPPTREAGDKVTFRGATAFVKFSNDGLELPNLNIDCSSNRSQGDPSVVDWRIMPGISVRYYFMEMQNYCESHFHGGRLWGEDSELYANPGSKVSFADMEVSGLKLQMFRHDGEVHLHHVTGDGMTVNPAVFNDQDNDRNLVVIDGDSSLGDFTLGGHYYNSKVFVTNANFTSFSLSRGEQTRYPEGAVLSNLLHTAHADLGTFYFGKMGRENFNQIPEYTYDFAEGTRLAFSNWDPIWFNARANTLRFSGEGTYATNVTLVANAPDMRFEVLDGAFAETRRIAFGYGTTNAQVRISGEGTTFLAQPNDMEFEGVVTVGRGNDGLVGAHNTLVIDKGAYVNISTNRSFKSGDFKTRLAGLMVGQDAGDDYNTVRIASGAVVTNDFQLCIGGGWMNDNRVGGSFNKVVVDNATLASSAALYKQEGLWDTTFFLGYQNGYSNSFEVVNGGYFKTHGMSTLGAGDNSGGSSILVDNSYADFGNRIMASRKNYAYGGHVITVGGTNGTIKTGCLCIDEGNTDITNGGFDLVFRLEKGRRSIPDAMLDFSGSWYDGNGSKDPFWGTVLNPEHAPIRLRFEIGDKWAHSGKDNSVVLISHGCESGHYWDQGRWSEAGLSKLYELYKDDPSLKGCTLSFVDSQEGQRPAQLILTAGPMVGMMVIVQ